ESWRGIPFTDEEIRSFQVGKILGKYAYGNVIHNKVGQDTYANIASIMPLPKSMPRPDPVNEDVVFDLDDRDMRIFEAFGDNLKATIMASREWTEKPASDDAPSNNPEDDDIPF